MAFACREIDPNAVILQARRHNFQEGGGGGGGGGVALPKAVNRGA